MNETQGSCELPAFNATTQEIADILKKSTTIAVVGLSPKPERPSFDVARYLKLQGYRIIPVNPGQTEILGERCYNNLLEVPDPVDIVDVFRDPAAVIEIAEHAIIKKAKVLWMQLGVINNQAAQLARKAGITVVMDRCLKIEHARWKPKN